MKTRIDFFSVLKQLPICFFVFSLAHVGENSEPFGLALLLGLGLARIPLTMPTIAFLLSAILSTAPAARWVYLGEALLLLGAFALRKKLFGPTARGKTLLPFSALTAGLLLYATLAEFTPYPLPFEPSIFRDALFQKAILSLFVFLFAAICAVSMTALQDKLLRCKMKADEVVFALITFVLSAVGYTRFFGLNAYMGIAFYILLTFCAVCKDGWGVVCAFALSLPALIAHGAPIERFFTYGVLLVAFAKTGKLGLSLALLCPYLFYAYLDGIYTLPSIEIVACLLCVLLPILLFLLTPQRLFERMESALIFYRERHLSRLAINRNRTAIAERLFEVSALFKEIQTTFLTLGNVDGETSAKAYMQTKVVGSVCKNCSGYGACLAEGLLCDVEKMLGVGCIKGKVSLIDVTPNLSRLCGRQSDLLYAMNCQLSEYRAYVQDAEAAANGRQLLASQALGISEIAKNLALEQSEPLNLYTKKERAIEDAMLKAGIVCSEILVCGGDEPTVSMIVFQNTQQHLLAPIVSHVLGESFCLAEKLTLAREKYCCILRKKPLFDAAFGVANAIKTGERYSGDCHTVVRIDERRFLVALSDGMGSGEYAKQISDTTVCLLESFYKAKLPTELTLTTVNRLLSFSKEETFACVDIAIVDLGDGKADVIKIGAPTGFILSDNSLRILEGDSLPLGILERIHPTTASYPLQAEDTLVFLSDGITEAFSSSVELIETVQALPRSNPQDFADRLLAIALSRYGGTAKDDLTVLAIRIFQP